MAKQAARKIAPVAAAPTPLKARLAEALARGMALFRAGKVVEALAAYDEALSISPDHPEALVNRGVALRRLGRREESVATYWRAMEAGADPATVLVNAANVLTDLNRLHEARSVITGALKRQPRSAEAWQALATMLLREKHERAAEACLRRAMALSPKDASIPLRIAALIAQDNRVDEALALFDLARRLGPLSASAHSGYGQTLISQAKLDEAEPPLRRALELDADNLDAHLGIARMLLLKGELDTGWVEYEWRRQKPESKIAKLAGKEWAGEPLAGKTVLVTSEQGFGDIMQFVRYMPLLAARGARVILAVPGALARLLQGTPGVAQLITSLKPMPTYDYHVPLLTVPRILGITVDTIPPPVPYARPTGPVPRIPTPLGTRLRVGIVWAGNPIHSNDRNRSLTLPEMMPIAGINGVACYSLQAGPRVGDLTKIAHPALVRDLSPLLGDFADTAAILPQIDVVICCGTSILHLAGEMGIPVWIVTPFAPDWRWIQGRDDCPWYPKMRLFRQTEHGRWDDVIERVVAELKKMMEGRPELGSDGDVVFAAAFPGPEEGKPRYRMAVPRPLLRDPGLRFLARRERSGAAYEYATRCFIDAHLEKGDVFVDVGAHWGIMSLHAATRWPGEVQALAIEPLSFNIPHLRRWIAANGLGNAIEVIEAAAADKAGTGVLRPESTMGHVLVRQEGGPVRVTTLDGLLAERPALAGRRLFVKIDVEGLEPEVVAGMAGLLEAGRVAAIIWERGGQYDQPGGAESIRALQARLSALGFTAWRFKSEDEAGPLVPFVEDGTLGNVSTLAPGLAPRQSYGTQRLPATSQPPDPIYDAFSGAQEKLDEGVRLQAEGKTAEALAAYANSAALDQRQPDLFNNLGVALRSAGKLAAAEAAYRRASALQPNNAGILSNLGNVLRERGVMAESEEMHRRALAAKPDDPRLIYNAALVYRDDGKPERAQAMFERVLEIDPNNAECKWDLALSYLQQGNYEAGLPNYEARWGLTRSPPRKYTLPRWQGEPLKGSGLFLHDEQGFGDVLMFARFIPEAKRRGAGKVVLECQPELMRLMALAPGVDQVVRRGSTPPAECALVSPLLSLPGLFGIKLDDRLGRAVPYLRAPSPELPLPEEERLRLGLVWAGKTTPRDRACPLDELLAVLGDPRFALYSLQIGPRANDLKKTGANAFVTDLAPRLHDFAETAALLSKLDLLVTIDTSVAHLAGALGIPTFLLLLYTSDWRWFDRGSDSPWYPNLTLFRQRRPYEWREALDELGKAIEGFAGVAGERKRQRAR